MSDVTLLQGSVPAFKTWRREAIEGFVGKVGVC